MFGQQPQQSSKPLNFNEWTNVLYLAFASFGACITPFLRSGFGRESFGLPFLGAFLINYAFMAMYPRHELITLYFLLWIAFTLIHRFRSASAASKRQVHSKSSGYPWVGFLPPWIKSYKGALGMELLVCFLGGVFLMPQDEPLGTFILITGVAAFIKHGMESDIDRARLTRMRDAEIEQRHLLDRYRRGDF